MPIDLPNATHDMLQPDETFVSSKSYIIDQQVLAFMLGSIAIGLPVVLMLGVVAGSCYYDSISHFYYARVLGDVFVAALAMIGIVLLAYRGENRIENRLASLAGVCTFGIAFFPVTGQGCETTALSARIFANLRAETINGVLSVVPAKDDGQFFDLFDGVATVHFASAALLFSFLAFYSFVVFRRVIPAQHIGPDGQLTPVKVLRNRIYFTSGVVILAAIAAIAARKLVGANWDWWPAYNVTFIVETLAMWAFGLSWMVKGRFWGKALLDPRDPRN